MANMNYGCFTALFYSHHWEFKLTIETAMG